MLIEVHKNLKTRIQNHPLIALWSADRHDELVCPADLYDAAVELEDAGIVEDFETVLDSTIGELVDLLDKLFEETRVASQAA